MLVVEPCKSGDEHFIINNAMLHVLKRLYCERLVFLADPDHYNRSSHDLPDVIALKTFFHFKKGFFAKFAVEFLLIVFSFLYALIKSERKIVFLSLSPMGHLLTSILAIFFFNMKCTVILHSELHYLVSDKRKIYRMLMKASFFIRPSRFFHIVLSDHIDIDRFFSKGNYIKINHPCVFSRLFSLPCHDKFYFTYVGMASYKKGLRLFEKVSESAYTLPGYTFAIAGKVVEKDFHSDAIGYYSFDFLDGFAIEDILRKTRCALFFYGDDYNWIASGAVLDCVKYSIPVICLRCDLFDELERRLGFVRCFDSVDEIIDFILDKNSFYSYIESCDFSSALEYFGVDSAVRRLRLCVF